LQASRWFAFDVDCHPDTPTAPEVLRAVAYRLYDGCRSIGFRPILEDSNGKGGFHVWNVVRDPVSTCDVHALARVIARHCGYQGESFPKQPFIKPTGFGNWLRLPGLHHSRNHWSRIYDGTIWLSGEDAAARLLTFTGDDPALVPLAEDWPEEESAGGGDAPCGDDDTHSVEPDCVSFDEDGVTLDLSELRSAVADDAEAEAALDAIEWHVGHCYPHKCAGQGRDDVAFSLACFLVRDLDLNADVALSVMSAWDAGNQPPKGESRLKEIIINAHEYGTSEYGSLLGGGE